jgi:hypothetical protein
MKYSSQAKLLQKRPKNTCAASHFLLQLLHSLKLARKDYGK